MQTMSDSDRYKSMFRVGFVLTLMLGFVIYSNFDYLRWPYIDSKSYRQTSGQILSSKIKARGTYSGWRFQIMYEYNVGDQYFISDRVHFGYQALEDRSYAENYVKKYPVGKQVVVFYDPSNPENSVLEPEVTWDGLLELYLTTSLLPISIFGFAVYFYVKSHRSQNRTP